jgi:hypothetical protein
MIATEGRLAALAGRILGDAEGERGAEDYLQGLPARR